MFPSMKAQELLAVLNRPPMRYHVARQTGSHRRLKSAAGYPPLTFAWRDAATIAPGLARKVLVRRAGLSVQEALRCLENARCAVQRRWRTAFSSYTPRPTGPPDLIAVPA